MKLSLETLPKGEDAKNLRVRLTVANNSKEPIGIDRQFVIFLKWHAIYDDGTPVKSSSYFDVEIPSRGSNRKTVHSARPGEVN